LDIYWKREMVGSPSGGRRPGTKELVKASPWMVAIENVKAISQWLSLNE
jgi:hypothetical protein